MDGIMPTVVQKWGLLLLIVILLLLTTAAAVGIDVFAGSYAVISCSVPR